MLREEHRVRAAAQCWSAATYFQIERRLLTPPPCAKIAAGALAVGQVVEARRMRAGLTPRRGDRVAADDGRTNRLIVHLAVARSRRRRPAGHGTCCNTQHRLRGGDSGAGTLLKRVVPRAGVLPRTSPFKRAAFARLLQRRGASPSSRALAWEAGDGNRRRSRHSGQARCDEILTAWTAEWAARMRRSARLKGRRRRWFASPGSRAQRYVPARRVSCEQIRSFARSPSPRATPALCGRHYVFTSAALTGSVAAGGCRSCVWQNAPGRSDARNAAMCCETRRSA
jgi:hypothetical protein